METIAICHFSLDYSRVEVAAAARRDGCSCGTSPQVHHNKADAVRSARPEGEFGRIFLGDIQGKWKKIRFVEKYCNMQIIEKVDYRVGQIYE